MNDQEKAALFERYKAGNCNEGERALVERVMAESYRQFDHADYNEELKRQEVWDNVSKRISRKRSTKIRSIVRYSAAAILLFGIFTFLHFYNKLQKTVIAPAQFADISDVPPGGNHAYLTLSDGSIINIDDQAEGLIASQGQVSIRKLTNGKVVYGHHGAQNNPQSFNTISTPRGGQFQVEFPDGSIVWLNAASSITFPASFEGLSTREVTLKGEGYFQVAKDAKRPFRVKTDEQIVEVLGTHFNVNSYSDEPNVTTTLLEGSVKVSSISTSLKSEKILQPGQKAVLHQNNELIISTANPYAVAWKDGLMRFESANIKTIMREISRWYDLDVIYKGKISEEQISAGFPRASNLSTVLAVLRGVGVQFTIDASSKRIVVQGK